MGDARVPRLDRLEHLRLRGARAMAVAGPIGLLAACVFGVVACGRVGFDATIQPGQDASLVDVAVPGFDAASADTAADTGDVQPGDDGGATDDGSDGASGCVPVCVNPHGTTSCDDAGCVPVCAAGYGDCDGDPSNGCEANLQGDPTHCGVCTNVCAVDSGSAICTGGTCGMSSCAPGTGDCDGMTSNGCETNLDTSAANCRFCGNACTFAHATGSCQGGTCVLGPCAPGYADCDGDASNGCEVELATNTGHCGVCTVACTNANGGTSCTGGTCMPSCNAGFGDCDSNVNNGCETATNTTSHCGSCGNVCTSDAGAPSCSGSTCGTTCDLSGTWAAKIVVQLTWPSTVALAAGSGALDFWAIVKGTQSGDSIPVTLTPCEITVPDFQSSPAAGSQLFGLTFPNTLFDHTPTSYLPASAGTVTLGGSSPGSTYSLPAVAFLLGLSMTNPTTDPWPSTPAMVTEVDMDQDTKFGVTTPYKTGGSYQPVPVTFPPPPTSDKAYLASRLVTSLSGTLSGCTSVSGTATVTHFDSHVVGCELSGGAGDCNATQSNYSDGFKPAYTVGTATVSMVKLANTAVCSDVRSAL